MMHYITEKRKRCFKVNLIENDTLKKCCFFIFTNNINLCFVAKLINILITIRLLTLKFTHLQHASCYKFLWKMQMSIKYVFFHKTIKCISCRVKKKNDFQTSVQCLNILNENSFSQTFRVAVNETTIW